MLQLAAVLGDAVEAPALLFESSPRRTYRWVSSVIRKDGRLEPGETRHSRTTADPKRLGVQKLSLSPRLVASKGPWISVGSSALKIRSSTPVGHRMDSKWTRTPHASSDSNRALQTRVPSGRGVHEVLLPRTRMGSANKRRMPTRARPLAFCCRFEASSARTTERSGAASRRVTCGGKAFSALTAKDFGRAGTTVVLNRAGSSTARAERVAVKLASHPILEIHR